MFERNEKNKEVFDKIEVISREIKDLHLQIQALQVKITAIQGIPTETKQQLDELILWKAKVTDMALGKTPTGRDKMTRFGKKIFGGRSI